MTDHRPDPDSLLALAQAEEERERRGKLKVFFGATAGVGKTFAMLQAAQELKRRGVDVVVGWVETHGRVETEALLHGLEILPPRLDEHRGVTLKEFDLDGALARRPAILLVDELAHTNAPGSRHAKRWQDVEELLDAGLDVYTAFNVQHLESLNDLIGKITSVVVRETVPDSILERADQVELVDLPPEELLKRLQEGKVYLPDQAERAMRSFFRPGNLIALREIALRKTAERVEAQMQRYRELHGVAETWPVAERLLVAVSTGPNAARLVRAARRLAERLRAEWVVVYVETPAELRLPKEDRDRVWQTLRLAEKLGAETVTLSGERPSSEILRYARRRNVSKIVVGKPTRARWRDFLFGSVRDQLERESGDVDVYVIAGEAGEGWPAAPRRPRREQGLRRYAAALLITALATGLCLLARPYLGPTNLVMIYPARRGRHGLRFRPRAVDPRLGAERRGLRFLLRAALLHLRRLGHRIPGHLRGHADHRPGDLDPHRAPAPAGRGRGRPRAAHGGPLRHEPRPRGGPGHGRDPQGRGEPHPLRLPEPGPPAPAGRRAAR